MRLTPLSFSASSSWRRPLVAPPHVVRATSLGSHSRPHFSSPPLPSSSLVARSLADLCSPPTSSRSARPALACSPPARSSSLTLTISPLCTRSPRRPLDRSGQIRSLRPRIHQRRRAHGMRRPPSTVERAPVLTALALRLGLSLALLPPRSVPPGSLLSGSAREARVDDA
ncbi:hypothetical protein C8R45DRAFT_1103107 [Mycena sanguinolenta]|nr:hypothetical protein C8R45DRAFT_1103107 [Mycena sanguinolenta]